MRMLRYRVKDATLVSVDSNMTLVSCTAFIRRRRLFRPALVDSRT